MREAFVGNFQGTYVHPGNSWDLKNCKQKKGETLHDYIRRFSQKCNELLDVADEDVVTAFLSGTTCESLVHKLGWKKPKTTKDLLDIATNRASGEEAVGVVFQGSPGKEKRDNGDAETSDNPYKKGRNRQRRDGTLVAVVDRKGSGAEEPNSDFSKTIAPCGNSSPGV